MNLTKFDNFETSLFEIFLSAMSLSTTRKHVMGKGHFEGFLIDVESHTTPDGNENIPTLPDIHPKFTWSFFFRPLGGRKLQYA